MSDEQDTTDENNQLQPPEAESKPQLVLLGSEQHQYDSKEILDFIDSIFPSVQAPAKALFYSEKTNVPHLPHDRDYIARVLERTTTARALYFNTATCVPDDSGKLRHKRDLFSAFHVLVLDDIGSKIPVENLPKGMEDPSYIIESSDGNFQYGYVLDEPITNYDHAMALVQTAALAGLTDKGGAMPCKVVRLPAGVNGKQDPDKRLFKVNLTADNNSSFTPEYLLDCINYDIDGEDVTWDKITSGMIKPLAKKYNVQHVPRQPITMSSEGILDEVLEWFTQEGMVLQDSGGDWVDIVCPWCDGHSDGNPSAGYTPLGRGTDHTQRGFNCFHDHCSERDTKDLLQYVMANSDFTSLPIYDPCAIQVGAMAFDAVNDRVWAINAGVTVFSMSGFMRAFNNKIWTYDIGASKPRKTTSAQHWLESPYRITVNGAVSEPGTGAVVTGEYGYKFVNTFKQPDWGTGQYDQTHVDKFMDFMDYLLPDPTERAFFLDWLASKVQDPTFRGTGMIMVAPTQGVGRSTLGGMLMDMFGQSNCTNVAFDTLVNPLAFNDWEDKLFVTVNEAREANSTGSTLGAVKAYEALKNRIDTTNTKVRMNVKYQPERLVTSCSSFLILTNHINAIAIPQDDRRLTVLTNPRQPETPVYFDNLNAWIDQKDAQDRPVWAKHVYRWLRDRVTSTVQNRAPKTAAKSDMTDSTQARPKLIMSKAASILTDQGIYAITTPQYREILDKVLLTLNDDTEYKQPFITLCMNENSIAFKQHKIRHDGNARKVRVFAQPVSQGLVTGYADGDQRKKGADLDTFLKNTLSTHPDQIDIGAIVTQIVDEIEE